MTLFNRIDTKAHRQRLRHEMTEAEYLLWQQLRGKGLGIKFRRQHGIGPYIVDFYAASVGLVIEVDGATHSTPTEELHDRDRTAFLTQKGLCVLRFTNTEIYYGLDNVLEVIRTAAR